MSYPGFDVIDAREGSPTRPSLAPLLDAVARLCVGAPRQLLLFDTLEEMRARWERETAGRFFSRRCPLLLGLGAIAYWALTAARSTPRARRADRGSSRSAGADVGDGRLRIAKAEGRPAGVEGSVFRYDVDAQAGRCSRRRRRRPGSVQRSAACASSAI